MRTRFSRKKLDKYSRTARPDVNSIRSEHDDDATSEHSMNEKIKKVGRKGIRRRRCLAAFEFCCNYLSEDL